MQVEIDVLAKACGRLLAYLHKCTSGSIDIGPDYYWRIPLERAFDMMQDPTVFHAGQLTEDWSELRKIANGDNALVPCDLEHLSALLDAIAMELSR